MRVLKGSIYFVIAIAVVIPLVIFRGWVLSILWGWFIVPSFGLPPLSIAAAIGLSLLTGYLTADFASIKKEYKEDPHKNLMRSICISVITLLMGYIVKLFM